MIRGRLAGGLLLAAAVALSFALYGRALDSAWCCDDPQILLHAQRHAPWQYFAVPQAWRDLIPFSLTPWLTLAYDIDGALFGLREAGYFAHHLLAIGLAAGLIAWLASLWVPPAGAAAGALLFLLGAPVAQASRMLMVRHYTEGLMWFLLALLLFATRLRGGSRWLGAACLLAYAAAASAKEVFLPLGFLALLMPLGTWQQRLRAAWPFGLVMLLYVPWRGYMLGQLLGGYGGESAARPGPAQVLSAVAGLPGLVWQPGFVGAAVGVAAAMALAIGAARKAPTQNLSAMGRAARGAPAIAAVAALLLAPLLPLVAFPGLGPGSERYLIVPWAAVSFGIAVAWGRCWSGAQAAGRGLAAALLLGVMLPAAWAGWGAWRQADALVARHAAFRDVLLAGDAGTAVLADPQVPDWYLRGLLQLRPATGRTGPPPTVLADELEFDTAVPRPRRVLRLDASGTRLVDVTGELPAQRQAWRARLRAAPLQVALERTPDRGEVRWRLAADTPGRFVLLAPGQRLEVPSAEGALRLAHPLPPCLRIRFDAAAGWSAYSPPLSWRPADDRGVERLAWQGEGDLFAPDRPAWCGPRAGAAAS